MSTIKTYLILLLTSLIFFIFIAYYYSNYIFPKPKADIILINKNEKNIPKDSLKPDQSIKIYIPSTQSV
jgi:hypothetical protein